MPDAPTMEPLWSRRMRAHAQQDASFFREARKRDGKAMPLEWVDQERECIDTNHDGRTGKMTGREKAVSATMGARAMQPQTRSVGVTAEKRAAVSQTNNKAFERLKAEESAERYNKGTFGPKLAATK